jgi:F0F1-type ATP synthase assembly protein I
MKKAAALSTATPPPTNTSPAAKTKAARPNLQAQSAPAQLRVGRELLETTWRIVVPVLLFAGIGILLDRNLGSKPWMTLLGTAIGFVFAGLLVKKLITDGPNAPRTLRHKGDES